jgi:hypothetical protein
LQQVTHLLHSLPGPSRPSDYWPGAIQHLQGKIRQQAQAPIRTAWRDCLTWSSARPAQALIPVSLIGMALFATVTFLGLEGEAFTFFNSYLLPFVLQ